MCKIFIVYQVDTSTAEVNRNNNTTATDTLYNCDVDGCKKVYKTKSGLARHVRSKHQIGENPQTVIHPLNLKVFMREAGEKLSKDLAFPEDIRKRFSEFALALPNNKELLIIFKQFEPVFKSYNGNAEKFYSKMFRFSLPDQPKMFTSLPRVLSNLMITEISSSSLAYLVGRKKTTDSEKLTFQWDDKSKCVVEYLAGYCFRTIFTRLHRSKKREHPEVQQIISLLKGAKLSDSNLAEKQRLINVKDRGGLWALNKTAVRIFEVCEEEFFTFSQGFNRSIDVNSIVPELCKNVLVKGNFKDLCRNVDSEMDKEIQANVLEKLVQLYLCVQTHAIAKSIKEKFKIQSKDSKKKSLRTELKRANNDDK